MLPVVQKAPQNLQCQLLMLQLACATEETEVDVIMLLLIAHQAYQSAFCGFSTHVHQRTMSISKLIILATTDDVLGAWWLCSHLQGVLGVCCCAYIARRQAIPVLFQYND